MREIQFECRYRFPKTCDSVKIQLTLCLDCDSLSTRRMSHTVNSIFVIFGDWLLLVNVNNIILKNDQISLPSQFLQSTNMIIIYGAFSLSLEQKLSESMILGAKISRSDKWVFGGRLVKYTGSGILAHVQYHKKKACYESIHKSIANTMPSTTRVSKILSHKRNINCINSDEPIFYEINYLVL